MSQVHLLAEDLKALDSTRQRLSQLASNIGSLKVDIQQSNPLPQWESLQASAAILAKNVQSMTKHLSTHSDLFQRTVVYPSTNYPGRTQEALLTQMLRKKLEPQVETWVDGGRAIQATYDSGKEEDVEEVWKWARGWMGDRLASYVTGEGGANYTAEEEEMGIENVRTGLQRKLEEEEEEDDDDESEEDEEMEDVGVGNTTVRTTNTGQVEYRLEEVRKSPGGKVRSVDEIMRFATSGAVLDQGRGKR